MKTTNTTITAATITSTTNTNNTTTATKEGKTMKNTKNIRTKVTASVLAAITAVTALAASASAAEIQTYPGRDGIEIAVATEENTYEVIPTGMNPYVAPVPADELTEGSIPASEAQPAADIELIDEISKKLEAGGSEAPEDATVVLPDDAFVSVPLDEDADLILTTAPVKAVTDAEATAALQSDFQPGDDVYQHTDNEGDLEGNLTEEQKEIARRIINAVADGTLDLLADAIPGGKLFGEPLKAILGEVINSDAQDPTQAALNRLSEDQKKYYEDLKKRIGNLNADLTKYTKFIEKTVVSENEKDSLGQMFRYMSANLNDLSSEVKGIMTNPDTTPVEKLVLLANVNRGKDNKNYLADTRQWADQISTTISQNICSTGETAIDMNLYNTLIALAEKNYMFAGEAHEEAMKSAQVLTEQYMYANTLVLQCQNAYKALEGLTPEQVEDLKQNPEIYEMYKKCMAFEDQSFQTDKQSESVSRILGCMAGFRDFNDKKAEGNRYINNGTQKEAIVLDFNVKNVKVPNSDSFRAQSKNQYFNEKEMGEFVDYVRQSGMSIKEFLVKNNQTITGTTNGKHCYLVIDATLTGSRTRKEYDFFKGSVYGYTQTIKVVDIYDPECRVQNLTVTTYDRDCTYGCDTIENIKSHGNDFIFIGAHKATDADNIK